VTAGCGRAVVTIKESLPLSEFDKDSTAEQVTEGRDLTGRVALVTGCNSGIGFETLRVLALRGAHVIGTGRTREKAEAACGSVTGMTTPAVLELSDFASVRACADMIDGLDLAIDMLICNAGVIAGKLEQVYGLEKDFVVNHLGHFILVNRLLARVQAAEQGRVVLVSSGAAYGGNLPEQGIEFDNLSGARDWDMMTAYAQSKLANALFSLELARRLKGSTATSNALHPGFIHTNIGRNAPAPIRVAGKLFGWLGKTTEQGAATTCYVATSPRLSQVSGEFFVDCNPVSVAGAAHIENKGMAAKLWQVSEELTADFLKL